MSENESNFITIRLDEYRALTAACADYARNPTGNTAGGNPFYRESPERTLQAACAAIEAIEESLGQPETTVTAQAGRAALLGTVRTALEEQTSRLRMVRESLSTRHRTGGAP